jgi:hypothetical protein
MAAQPPVQLGDVREALGEVGVDTFPVAVQPEQARPPRPQAGHVSRCG